MPIVLCGAETWSMAVAEKKYLNVMEIRCMRSICGVMHKDQVRNELRKGTSSFIFFCYWQRHGQAAFYPACCCQSPVSTKQPRW